MVGSTGLESVSGSIIPVEFVLSYEILFLAHWAPDGMRRRNNHILPTHLLRFPVKLSLHQEAINSNNNNADGINRRHSMPSSAINISFFDPNVNQIYGENRNIIAEEITKKAWMIQLNLLNQALEVTNIS